MGKMISRREMLKMTAVGAAGLLLAACAPQATQSPTATTAPAQPAASPTPSAAATPTVAAAIPTTSSSGATTINFWNSFTGSDATELTKLVNDFNSQNTGSVHVNMNIMSADVFNQKVPPAIATKTAPDLITLNVADVLAYEKQGAIQDLSDFLTLQGVDKTDFLPGALALGFDDNKQYGIPMQVFDSTNLFWNKDLFTAAGLDPNTPPKTFAELEQFALKLTDSSKQQFGLGLCGSAAPQWYAIFIKGNGGDVVDMTTNKSILNSDVNMQTFQYLYKLQFTDGVTPKSTGGVAMDNLMQAGKIGLYFDGPWLIPGLKSHNINFGIAQVPSGSAGSFAIYDGTLFAVPTGTDATRKAAVYQFLKYWNTTAVGKAWSLSDGMPPYLKSVINDPDIKADPTISLLASNATIAQPWLPGLPSASNINTNVLFPLVEQLQYSGNVTDEVNKASAHVDSILQGGS